MKRTLRGAIPARAASCSRHTMVLINLFSSHALECGVDFPKTERNRKGQRAARRQAGVLRRCSLVLSVSTASCPSEQSTMVLHAASSFVGPGLLLPAAASCSSCCALATCSGRAGLCPGDAAAAISQPWRGELGRLASAWLLCQGTQVLTRVLCQGAASVPCCDARAEQPCRWATFPTVHSSAPKG